MRSIVAAAESMAAAIRREAEQDAELRRREAEREAQEYLEEARRRADALVLERKRRIAELSDLLIERAESILDRLEQADAVRSQLQALVQALGETAHRVARESSSAGSGREPADAARVPAGPPPGEGPRRGEPAVSVRDLDREQLDAARLVALQMAVAGGRRDEIAAHLSRELGIRDAAPLVDEVLESDAGRR